MTNLNDLRVGNHWGINTRDVIIALVELSESAPLNIKKGKKEKRKQEFHHSYENNGGAAKNANLDIMGLSRR